MSAGAAPFDRLSVSAGRWTLGPVAIGYVTLVVAYLATRLALVWRLPWHYDEAVFAGWTLQGYENVESRFLPLASGQQTLLEWLGMGGMRLGLEPVTSLRFVSLSAGLITLVLVAMLARRLAGEPAGVAAAALYVVLPYTLVYSVAGLYDPLAAMLVVAALLLQIEIAERPRLGLALLLGLVLAAALLTKLTATIALSLLPLSAIAFDWSPEARPRRLAAWLGSIFVALLIAWLGSRILHLSDLNDDLQPARDALLGDHSLREGLGSLSHWVAQNGPAYSWALVAYVTPVVFIAAIIGAVAGIRRTPRRTAIVVAWVVLPYVAVIVLASFPAIRWLLVAVPPLEALAGVGVVAVCAHARELGRTPRSSTWFAVGAVGVLVLPAVAFSGRILARPSTAWYPGRDRFEFTDGAAWAHASSAIGRLAAGRPMQVVIAGYGADQPRLHLRSATNITLVEQGTAPADGALYLLQYGIEPAPRPAGLGWRQVGRFPAAAGRDPVLLFRSAGVANGRTATSAAELRAAIGGSDADYDAFVAAHPAVKTWLEALLRAEEPQ